ncbi:autotransporter assembly complex family protein [Psychromonas sp.]|uniref:autotransporter assembly complex protein TamA n=1 Tax=Psychromonas sp. TaxID=1884585 RepID=UPI0035613DD8
MKIFKIVFLLLSLFVHAHLHAAVKFDINGVDDSDVEDNIEVFLNALSQPKDANNQSYLKQVGTSARQAVTALGYYQMQFKTVVTGEIGKQTVTLDVNLGEPTRITEFNLKLIGEGSSDPDFLKIVKNFPLKENDILNHGKYEDGKSQLKKLAQRNGYFDSKFEKATVEVLSENNKATANIWFNTGIRYQFGDLNISPELPAAKFISALQKFKAGDPYDSRVLSKFNAEANETGYFKNIAIVPEMQKKQGRQIPLLVVANMRPKDSFSAGIGISTDEGIRGKFRWTRPWVNQYGHSLIGNVVASLPKQEASLTYNIPIDEPLYHYYSLQSGYKMVNNNDTDTTQYLFTVGRHKRLEGGWLRNIFISYDKESGTQGQEDFSSQLIMPGISFSRNRSRGGINATWGDAQQFSLKASHESWLSSSDLLKVYGRSKFLRTYNGHQFISTTELGAIFTDTIDDVPSSMRFFSGGDQSIRGYGYESIAPEDEDGFLIGGKYLAVQSLEYRLPITQNWKLATFLDAGTVTSDFDESISFGSGIGAVWSSPVGPVRFYLAAPVNNSDQTIDQWTIHFMIGPEL